jgi:hypothetical protein
MFACVCVEYFHTLLVLIYTQVDANLGKAIGAGIGLSPACALKP